jgi:hypothetical protein
MPAQQEVQETYNQHQVDSNHRNDVPACKESHSSSMSSAVPGCMRRDGQITVAALLSRCQLPMHVHEYIQAARVRKTVDYLIPKKYNMQHTYCAYQRNSPQQYSSDTLQPRRSLLELLLDRGNSGAEDEGWSLFISGTTPMEASG